MTEKGIITYRCRDRFGEIAVIDRGQERILSFGSQTKQSVMRRDTPHLLSSVYTQAMMTALVFQHQPQRALFLGLGGGTMPSFLLRHYPECQIDCVELRPEVVRTAHSYFNLPAKNKRLRVVIDDASHFLTNRSGDFDLIFLDLFSESGPASFAQDESFLASCRNNLSRHGILICNTWTVTQANFNELADVARKTFFGSTLTLKLAARYNAVVFAFQDGQMLSELRKRRAAAEHLHRKTGINFPGYLRQIIQQNIPFKRRLLLRA